MDATSEFDLIVIGGGPGGYTAALEAAARGWKTALVERDRIGGTCLVRGCIPTKIQLHTAGLARQAREGAAAGLVCPEVSVDTDRLLAYQRQVIGTLSDGIAGRLHRAGVALFSGSAFLPRPGEVAVQGAAPACLRAAHTLLAVGSEPAPLPVPGAGLPGVFDSTGLLEAPQRCESLVIVGGGVIGMEFASLYAALGARVTVLEAADRILSNLDREFGQNLKMILKKQGVEIRTGALLGEIAPAPEGLVCRYTEKGAPAEAAGRAVLTAVGRRPATAGLFAPGCAPAAVRGRITVDETYATDIPGLYAVGDATGGVQLAHAAEAAALNAVAAMQGRPAPVRAGVIPACVYTSPEIASVGLTADEAAARGIPALSRRYVMGANGKSVLTRQERGFLKFVFSPEGGALLGVQMMCARATDMIGEFSAAVGEGATVAALAAAVRPHPTFNEAVWELARECAAALPAGTGV